MNTPAAVAAIVVFLIAAIFFGHPGHTGVTEQPTGVASSRISGR